ncbi:MAG: glycosyl hydrolase family 15 [Saprospiraceae bacterium]|nr:glycosyl hydrolase family 15 [Saprospiraceae bacterium]
MNRSARLLKYHRRIKAIILDKQHPITGLLPASTAITEHGNYTDAWVRDNVYSILCVWGLSMAMKSEAGLQSQQFGLEQATINLMQGLLRSMMQQADKVEKFKSSLALHDALHAKYDTTTGHPVVADHEWGHLQIDATSIFMLMLAQMVKSGLPIITNNTEVDFVQNLVYYIERAYRTPDYGIWERGEKSNVGYVELNASSLGMAKAALTALDGLDLLGKFGSEHSIIHVVPDNLALAEITLNSLLPRESVTKEIDSALLSIVGFPAFAISDKGLREDVLSDIRTKLGGNHGYKRFLRDGHQTAVEDQGRHFYNEEELKIFADIECEWPLFYTYELINAAFSRDAVATESFYKKITDILIEKKGAGLIPELYIVPLDKIDDEKKAPGSQSRLPNENIPLVWAQSLFYLGSMLRDNLLSVDQLDPLHLHERPDLVKPTIQVALISQTRKMQIELSSHGINTDCIDDIPPEIQICTPEQIAQLYQQIGQNRKLNLSGRPVRRLKSLATSRLFVIRDKTYICLALPFLEKEFYLAFDSKFLIARFKNEIAYIYRHWKPQQRPTIAILLTEGLIKHGLQDFRDLVDEMNQCHINDIPIVYTPISDVLTEAKQENFNELEAIEVGTLARQLEIEPTSYLAYTEESAPLSNEMELEIEVIDSEDVLADRLRTSANLYEQIKILDNLTTRYGLNHKIKIADQEIDLQSITTEIYERAGRMRIWSVVRHAAALLDKIEINLQFSITSLLVRQKIIQVGKAFTDDSLIIRPLPFNQLIGKIKQYCREDQRDRVLTQEILVFLGIFIRDFPHLFEDLITIRVSYVILLLTGEIARQKSITQEDGYEELLKLAPSDLQDLLRTVLEKYNSAGVNLQQLESLHGVQKGDKPLSYENNLVVYQVETPGEGWLVWRRSQGVFHKANDSFYAFAWNLFKQSKGIIIGDKLDRRNRLESRIILADLTPGDRAFELRIEYLLNKISAPEYRQLTIESIMVTSSFGLQNPNLFIDDYIVFDIINGHAVRLAFSVAFPDLAKSYQDHKADAWTHFYRLPPIETNGYIVKAIMFLLRSVSQSRE